MAIDFKFGVERRYRPMERATRALRGCRLGECVVPVAQALEDAETRLAPGSSGARRPVRI